MGIENVMTPERIVEIEANVYECRIVDGLRGHAYIAGQAQGYMLDAAVLLDAFRRDVPDLIARIEELERDNAALEAQVEALKGDGGEPRTTSIKAALSAKDTEIARLKRDHEARLLKEYVALRAQVERMRDDFARGAREGWMRCGVYHIDIHFEGRPEELAEVERRWPLPAAEKEPQS